MGTKQLFKHLKSLFIIVLCSPFLLHAESQKLIMGRSVEAFPETMAALQEEIKNAGYIISMIQRVDIGLTGMGFQTDKYRVVFFAKPEQIKILPKKCPQLTPYLPLAIAIFAEQNDTILTAMSPDFIAPAYTNCISDPMINLSLIFQQWQSDIETIINHISQLE
jgi:uncharacterized protein (DUF302 family)